MFSCSDFILTNSNSPSRNSSSPPSLTDDYSPKEEGDSDNDSPEDIANKHRTA